MKHTVAAFCAISLLVGAAPAQESAPDREQIDALLVVQNHASDEFQKPLSNLGDRLSERLSGERFNIIDPNDAIGEDLNRGPWGENMPLSSATRLAENLDAQALITAAVGETSVVGYGAPARVQAIRMTLTLSAKKLPKGATVASVTVTETSPKMTPEALSQNAEAVYAELVGNLVAKASEQFLSKCETVRWRDIVLRLVEVGFGCNFPGADVSIDGVSYGTAGTIGQPPLRVRVSEGLHNLKISYPYTEPFEVRAKLQEGTTFMVVLRENEEGRRIRKEDAHFDALIDRIYKSGATDDDVRILRAQGYARYLESSYTRIHGMPQFLSMRDCEMPDFGLNPDREGDGVETRTGDLIDAAGTAAGVAVPQRQTTRESGDNAKADASEASDGNDSKKSREDSSSNGAAREPQPDNTGIGVTTQQQPSVQAVQPVPVAQPVQQVAPPPQNEAIQDLHDIREGVETSKDIVQGIKDIWDIVK